MLASLSGTSLPGPVLQRRMVRALELPRLQSLLVKACDFFALGQRCESKSGEVQADASSLGFDPMKYGTGPIKDDDDEAERRKRVKNCPYYCHLAMAIRPLRVAADRRSRCALRKRWCRCWMPPRSRQLPPRSGAAGILLNSASDG